ncbi:MAG: S41 family peptidase [Alloprevotella sp.]
MKKESTYRYTPILVAIGVVVGILTGSFYASHFSGQRLNIINNSTEKINSLFHIIDDQYVDDVKIDELVESAMPAILAKLDPHSVYIPASEAKSSMEDLQGSFSGVGVQFMIYKDTVRVVKVIAGGPSEHVGVRAGDRIVAIDGKPFTGKVATNDETRKRLKGAAETQVRLTVVRSGEAKPLNFTITRGDVPVQSIDLSYMLDAETGYIRIRSFGETTYAEWLAALAELSQQGLQRLIIDLRGNLGGYMAPAIQIANEFLPKGRLIVYTQGRKSPREEYTSDGRGTYQTMPLVLLVDESSASASEILAGAIQDNDRGTIVGRRTFGKGLVQVPIEFSDGSMLRLTKARYYTPSGRCVQKPYTPGDEEEYEMDLLTRAEHGEYFSRDSIKTSGEKYHTKIGRVVYGGGGIIPDVFIPRDTLGITSWYRDVYLSGVLSEFAYEITDRYRAKLAGKQTATEVERFLAKENIVEQLAVFAAKAGIKRRNNMIRESHDLIFKTLCANVIDETVSTKAASEWLSGSDQAIIEALQILKRGEAFPRLTPESAGQKTASASMWMRSTLLANSIPFLPFNKTLALWPRKRTSAVL